MTISQPETFCPYVGLQPYTEAEREYFFGRERDERVIVSNLYAAPLTVLYGASGVGKSSVLLAGVVPRLCATPRTAVVVFREWQDATFFLALRAACIAAVEQASGKPLSLDANLQFDELLAQASRILNGSVIILLDQFEEYFFYHGESRADDSFDAGFARAVNREDVNAPFLLALREDGLSKLDRFRTRIPNLLGNTLRLQHLNASAAEDAIRKPLDVYSMRFKRPVSIEDALVYEVIQSINVRSTGETAKSDVRIETPFLQLVMTRLWDEEMKAGSSTLRMSTLQRLGGADRILRTHLDRVMERLSKSERSTSALFFDRLVTPSGAKIAQRVDDLITYAKRPEQQIRPILKKLSEERVLRPIAPPPGEPSSTRYEIFHDVLAPAILDWRERYERQTQVRKWAWVGSGLASVILIVIIGIAAWTANQYAQMADRYAQITIQNVQTQATIEKEQIQRETVLPMARDLQHLSATALAPPESSITPGASKSPTLPFVSSVTPDSRATTTAIAGATSSASSRATVVAIATSAAQVIQQASAGRSCSVAIADWFGKKLDQEPAWRASLGCPTDMSPPVETVTQQFEYGLMLWREDTLQIYVLALDGKYSVYNDTWDPSQPEGAHLAPPANRVEPIRGFGKIWREQLGGPTAQIGWALNPEVPVKSQIQNFESGFAYRDEDGDIKLFSVDGRWKGL